MVRFAEVGPKDVALEVGPGRGILTEELLKTGARVVAVEKDPRLFGFLKEKFASEEKSGKLVLIRADIRDVLTGQIGKNTTNKVVANIPYYLTGQLLRLLLTQTKFGSKMLVLMLQKEVARRIASHGQPPVLSKLAISVQVFAEPKIAFYIKKGNFLPRPKVDSAVVVFKRRKKDFFREHKISQKKFFELIHAGFAHPRKLLKSNLKISNIECWTKCEINANARAEDLSLENWACLARHL